MGSRSCAGKENLTAAMSETPINRLSILRKVLSFELSSGVWSIAVLGTDVARVDAPACSSDGAREPSREAYGDAFLEEDRYKGAIEADTLTTSLRAV